MSSHYPPYVGGLEHVVASVSEGLAASGYDVEVATTDAGCGAAPRREVRRGVRVRRHRALTVGSTPLSPGLLLSLLRLPRGSVVHAHYPHAGVCEAARLACWLTGSRLVLHVHLDVTASGAWGRLLLPAYRRWVLGPTLRSAHRVLALSTDRASALTERYRLDASRIVVVPNAVHGVTASCRHGSPGTDSGPVDDETSTRPFRVLLVGRLGKQKNVARFLRALALTHIELEAVVVGSGEERGRLERLAHELGLRRLTFTGEVSRAEVDTWMDWADVLVSSSDLEGMPLVMLEAMAAGLPVLSTDVDGSRELLGQRGLVVDPTAAALAAGIERLAGDATLRRSLAASGQELAASMSWSSTCRAIAAEYEELAS